MVVKLSMLVFLEEEYPIMQETMKLNDDIGTNFVLCATKMDSNS